MMKDLFLDVETTGLDPLVNAVHQVSGQIFIDGELVERFDFNVQPHKGSKVNMDAIKVSNITMDDLRSYPDNFSVHRQLTELLGKYVDKFDKTDKFFFHAYNAGFDNSFMWEFFKNAGDNYWGSYVWSGYIDVMVMAANRLKDVRATMLNFKLITVAKQLGIQIDETQLHNSQYDIDLTKMVYDLVK